MAKEFIHHEEVSWVVATTKNPQTHTAPRVNAELHNPKDNQWDSGFKAQSKPLKQKFNNYTPLVAPITEIYQQIFKKGVLPRARPLKGRTQNARNKSLFCDYHQGYEHKTQDCYDLRDAIEYAIRDGKLSKFAKIIREPRSLDRERSPKPETRNPRNPRDEDDESMTMVNVITGSSAIDKSILALKKDLKILACMVISAKLGSGLVRRILVDTGADSNIMFRNAFDASGFKNDDMKTHQPGVMGLGDHFIKPNGGRKTINDFSGAMFTKFLVMKYEAYSGMIGTLFED
ncbi:hypothetical protein PIB30_095160 [Stylosanthes scabra]|uniref:Peptidase A2 domain-containing protein n=1 Tax=Stylosanthes scabra TaxID=79078 RepID=A0ABU6YTV6_9FABA|nr:hypothetical protein [Stylosanthes scabra]